MTNETVAELRKADACSGGGLGSEAVIGETGDRVHLQHPGAVVLVEHEIDTAQAPRSQRRRCGDGRALDVLDELVGQPQLESVLDGVVVVLSLEIEKFSRADDLQHRQWLTLKHGKRVILTHLSAEMLAPDRPGRVSPVAPVDSLDLHSAGITSIVWATGYRRNYDWLELPVLDRRGEIAQYQGVTSMPGVYVLGQRFQHYRSSNFIDGVGRDALAVAEHITATPARRELLASASTPRHR